LEKTAIRMGGTIMSDLSSKWLCETSWLAEHLGSPGLIVLDATMPVEEMTGHEQYLMNHLPGALYFDIDEISDTASSNPHMLPSPEKFALRMRKMGVGDGMRVVVYDQRGMFSAPRVWWMLRIMGHNDVAVLNGGLPKWRSEGRPLDTGDVPARSERHFTPRKDSSLVRDLDDMKAILADGKIQVVDARSAARFAGREPEPRPVPRLGAMPGARNVPFHQLLNRDATFKPADDLRAVFTKAGVDPAKPVVTTCGSASRPVFWRSASPLPAMSMCRYTMARGMNGATIPAHQWSTARMRPKPNRAALPPISSATD
jgi:thiosulfate/3-mercaptopyruvate sulfurtransferase